ncbi:MAG: hypothetical protein KQI35_11975 [Bacteroidetes bacterium]|nr:hypothetical protein [Bacteroidota bacterium]
MRKSLLLFATFLMMLAVTAQDRMPQERALTDGMVKVTNQVGDFTITDSDGNTWNLYEQLDLGKTVFLDLFFST